MIDLDALTPETPARTDRHLTAKTGELRPVRMAPISGPLFEEAAA